MGPGLKSRLCIPGFHIAGGVVVVFEGSVTGAMLGIGSKSTVEIL